MKRVLAMLICLSVGMIIPVSPLKAEFFYYQPDTTHITISPVPDLVSLSFVENSSWNAAMYAASKPYLVSSYDFVPLGDRFASFKIEAGYTLHTLGAILITQEYLFLNPFIPDVAYFLQVYDLDSLTLQNEIHSEHPTVYRGAALHPDGKRLFLSYNDGYERPWISGVDVYYINTGELLPYITPSEITSHYERIAPTDIQILPTGETFFILDGGTGYWFGPILQIDISSKEVIRVIRPEDGSTRLIRLNPKDWAV